MDSQRLRRHGRLTAAPALLLALTLGWGGAAAQAPAPAAAPSDDNSPAAPGSAPLAAGRPAGRPASVRLLIQSSPLAGFRYHEAPRWFADMKAGDALELSREPDNPHDARAIQVRWHGHLLGYVPRAQNETLAWAIDRGDTLSARISRLRQHPNPRLRVEFEVFVE
ncbi:MAG TPA: HIRAN domain-containing protein [Burkholderiales bacterium]|nr:HIRAN domain-containing protein [Burkholderiales bacterium]